MSEPEPKIDGKKFEPIEDQPTLRRLFSGMSLEDIERIQSKIDTFFSAKPVLNYTNHEQVLKFAKLGVDTPEALTSDEMKAVCAAFLAHCTQSGIG